MRKTFLQAEQYILENRDDDYFALSDTIKSYPLYPYLHYQWLARHLDDNEAVRTFLHDHPDTRYASMLHRKWLARLGSKQEWATFVKHYVETNDVEQQCFFAEAQYVLGQKPIALEKAVQLWAGGKALPHACDKLVQWLKESPAFTPELVWQRFQAALTQNHQKLAKQIVSSLPPVQKNTAEIWLKLHKQPQIVKNPTTIKTNDPKAGELFSHAIVQWLEHDPAAALSAWDSQKTKFKLPASLKADTEKRLGMALAFRRDRRAYQRLSEYAGDDPSAQEWRVRAALSHQSWPNVLSALDALNDELKHQDKWQYWRARALQGVGKTQDSQTYLRELAKRRSFYAFMAASQLKEDITLDDHPLTVSKAELKELHSRRDFMMISELLNLDRKTEAALQWWHAIAGLNSRDLKVAAKLAQEWDWPSTAIYTIAKAKHWDDMDLRFPLIFRTDVREHADRYGLDPAMIYGIIRQESAFDEFAGSPAGAMGLMQLMPKTAQRLAGELKERWRNDYNLLLPAINIKYGSYYFKKLFDRYNGHYAMAIAAYNAGPSRVKQWLPQEGSMPADIWIETIPYKETRAYVSSVVMNTLIYQKRLQRNTLKVTDFTKEIGAK
ncbi:MAG: transglycosylase SLT domain-containing protein [Gammaproteobacteria bacterium]